MKLKKSFPNLVMDRVLEMRVLVFGSAMEKWVLRQVEQGFSSFFDKCLPYVMIFQSSIAPSVRATLKNHQKMAKN